MASLRLATSFFATALSNFPFLMAHRGPQTEAMGPNVGLTLQIMHMRGSTARRRTLGAVVLKPVRCRSLVRFKCNLRLIYLNGALPVALGSLGSNMCTSQEYFCGNPAPICSESALHSGHNRI